MRNARCAERGAKCVPRGTRASACFALISEETGAALLAALAGLCTCCVAPRLGPSGAACFRAGRGRQQAKPAPKPVPHPVRGVAWHCVAVQVIAGIRLAAHCGPVVRGHSLRYVPPPPTPPRNPRRQIFIPGQTAAALSDSDGSATPTLGWVGRAWRQRAMPTGRSRPRSGSGTERLQSRG